MKKVMDFKELLLAAIALVPMFASVVVWDKLPEQMPIHWDMNGEVNGLGPRWSFPLVTIGLYLMLLALPLIDPLKKNYDIFGDTYFKLKLVLLLFLAAINLCIIASVLGYKVDLSYVIPPAVFLLVALLGNYMGTLRRNYFVGYKLPWTLQSDDVWKRTHVFAGKLWFWGGLLGFALAITGLNHEYVIVSLMSIVGLSPVVYAFFASRNSNR